LTSYDLTNSAMRNAAPGFFCARCDRRPQVFRHLAQGSAAGQMELRTEAAHVAAEYGN
jgi:hypothetical protein